MSGLGTWQTIVFTQEGNFEDEHLRIQELLENGVDLIHIRKPDTPLEDVRSLIEKIPPIYHSRLKIHDHFPLMDEFALRGVHLNRRNPIFKGGKCHISKSCHSFNELQWAKELDYVTLSPIFDSISKEGYESRFSPTQISLRGVTAPPVIGLGGVTPDRFEILFKAGFSGGALLGYVWSGDFSKRVQEILKYSKMLKNEPLPY